MDILVRKIDSKVIAKIDKRCQELTNKTGKKWSRNKYLKVLIESDFDRQLTTYKKDQFDLLLEKFIAIQTKNTQILNDYVHTNNQLIETLIGGRYSHEKNFCSKTRYPLSQSRGRFRFHYRKKSRYQQLLGSHSFFMYEL